MSHNMMTRRAVQNKGTRESDDKNKSEMESTKKRTSKKYEKETKKPSTSTNIKDTPTKRCKHKNPPKPDSTDFILYADDDLEEMDLQGLNIASESAFKAITEEEEDMGGPDSEYKKALTAIMEDSDNEEEEYGEIDEYPDKNNDSTLTNISRKNIFETDDNQDEVISEGAFSDPGGRKVVYFPINDIYSKNNPNLIEIINELLDFQEKEGLICGHTLVNKQFEIRTKEPIITKDLEMTPVKDSQSGQVPISKINLNEGNISPIGIPKKLLFDEIQSSTPSFIKPIPKIKDVADLILGPQFKIKKSPLKHKMVSREEKEEPIKKKKSVISGLSHSIQSAGGLDIADMILSKKAKPIVHKEPEPIASTSTNDGNAMEHKVFTYYNNKSQLISLDTSKYCKNCDPSFRENKRRWLNHLKKHDIKLRMSLHSDDPLKYP